MMGWGRRGDGGGGFWGEGVVAGAEALVVEGDAGVESTGVGVEGFRDGQAGGDDTEVYFQPDILCYSWRVWWEEAVMGGGERGKRYIFAMEMPTPSPGFWGQLGGWRGVWVGE